MTEAPKAVAVLRMSWRRFWLVPALAFLLMFFVLPIIRLMTSQVGDAYNEVLASEFYRKSLLGSLQLSAIVTIAAVLLAIPVASLLTSVRSRTARGLIYVLILSPILTSAVVRTYGWLIVFSSSGPINTVLERVGLISEPVQMLYTYPAMLVAVVHVLLPFAVLPIANSFANLDVDVQRAAETLGAGRLRVFATVTLPQIWSGCLTAGLIVFSLAMGDYVTPILVGGSTQSVGAIQAYVAYSEVGNPQVSAALGVYILLIVLVVSAIGVWRLRAWERTVRG